MTFAVIMPPPGERFFVIPPIPIGLLSAPLLNAVERYTALYWAERDGAEDPWADAANDIAEHVATSGVELAVKLIFVAHYDQPGVHENQLAVDLEAFDVGTGRSLIQAAADAVAMDPRVPWLKAYWEYERLRTISDAIPEGGEGEDAALDAYCAAMDVVIATPAPHVRDVRYKLELIRDRSEGSGTPEMYWQAVADDLTRLGERP